MQPRLGDLLAAVLCALWAVAVLPLWGPAGQMLNDDFLLVIGPMIGFAAICVLLTITVGALTIAARLLTGDDWARLRALMVGLLSAIGGLWYLLAGVVPSPADPWAFSTWLLAIGGGPLIVVLVISAGLELRRTWTSRTVFPQRVPSAPPSIPPLPSALPVRPGLAVPPGLPVPPLLPVAPPVSDPTHMSASDAAHDYWVRAAEPTPEPALANARTRPEPFWENLTRVEAVAFAVLAGVVVLGAVWTGGRYQVGPHPVAGLCMIMGGLAVGTLLEAWRRRRIARRASFARSTR
ncbi:MAG: hypothetical protein QOJ92_2792 [Frankiales bacterium]|nr:hypothetical protein [Frankiales bacterium]